jgi:aminoglycoside phosphotransferase (APT) family kinase protein
MSREIASMLKALRRVLPGGENIKAIQLLTTGFSNDTYHIEGLNLILRLPPAAGAMLDGHDVIAQARIYQGLGRIAGGPPVPEIAFICEDVSLLGAPFFAMECIAGEAVHDTDLQDWFTGASDPQRGDYNRQWVSAFAGLARLDPLPFLGTPVLPEDDVRMWQAFAQAADCPELAALFDRLLAVPAPRSGPPAVVHGDTKLSNLMWQDGRISAVLDWEMALNGEPLADLGYMLYGFNSAYHGPTTPQKQPGMLDRNQVIALWEQVSGRSAEGVFWHEIAQIGKISAIIAEGVNMHVTGRSTDPKLTHFLKNRDYFISVMQAMLDGGGF